MRLYCILRCIEVLNFNLSSSICFSISIFIKMSLIAKKLSQLLEDVKSVYLLDPSKDVYTIKEWKIF